MWLWETSNWKEKKWASEHCRDTAYYHFAILKGNSTFIRKELYKRDSGFYRNCGVYDENWEVDHIKPVIDGGGTCGLDNYQTLCPDCHKEKTKNQIAFHRKAISSQEAVKASTFLLYAAGETLKIYKYQTTNKFQKPKIKISKIPKESLWFANWYLKFICFPEIAIWDLE